jgi:glycosyltransferase involved in cell wall biosynthesis
METGGTQMLIVDILNELCRFHDMHLIIVNNEFNTDITEKINKKVNIYYLNRKKGSKSPSHVLKLNYLIRKIGPDAIHCHEPNMGNFLIFNKFYTILTIHDMDRIVNNLGKYQKLTAISKAVAQDFGKRYGLEVQVINNGIDFSCFKKRKEYSYGSVGTIKLVQVSRLIHPKKGQDILLDALHSLIHNYNFKNVQVDFIGDGDSLEFLKEKTLALNLNNHVSFKGNKSRAWLMENLCNYHALVQPSRYEGFGLTVLEGIASGLPVVASDIAGPAEILNLSPVNLLFEVDNSEDCARQILHLNEAYTGERFKEIMNLGYKLISEKYSLVSMVNDYLEIYQEFKK